jgi:hypothetical protein
MRWSASMKLGSCFRAPAAAAWLRDLEAEFTRNVNRVHRLRNAILHGYPLQPEVVRVSAPFARSISIHAAHSLIDGAATGRPLLAHLDSLRRRYTTSRDSLLKGASPVDAFGWTAGR